MNFLFSLKGIPIPDNFDMKKKLNTHFASIMKEKNSDCINWNYKLKTFPFHYTLQGNQCPGNG